jgi:spore coat polysaccharide biosynthesis protein SpsF
MKTLIVVQARTSSTRLPGKVLLPILGKTLLYRMIERLQIVQHPVRIVIATSTLPEDDAIAAEAASMNVACFRGSLNNLLDRHYQAALQYEADVVLKIPSDCPLIDPRIVDRLLDFYFQHEGEFDYVSNLHPPTYPDGNDVEIMTMDCLKRTWESASRQLELEHTTPYIWENPDQFRIGNVVWETGLDYAMSHRFTIDYGKDYAFIQAVFEALYPGNPAFSCEEIINLTSDRPGIHLLNHNFAGVNWYRNHLDELKTIDAGMTKTTIV